jgi:hypothetical protein
MHTPFMTPPEGFVGQPYRAYGWRPRSIGSMRGHGGCDGQWIHCDPSGHCQWIARTSVAAARLRLYNATRGALPTGVRLETTCGDAR